MEIYEKIKNRRKKLGLSADDVAESLGVSRATVYRYESAEIEKVPITALVPLAKVLKCSPGYLMGWDEGQKPAAADQSDSSRTRLLSYYDSFNQAGKAELLRYARLMDKDDSYKKGLSDSLEDRMA